MLGRVQVEHELRQRAFEPREAGLEHHKARARELGRGLEVHQPQRLAQLEMLLRREIFFFEIARQAELVMLDIVFGVLAVRHFVERQVRDRGENRVQLGLGVLRRLFELRQIVLQRGDLGHQRIGARLVFRLLGFADLFGGRVAPRLRLLEGGDRRAPLLIERQKARRRERRARSLVEVAAVERPVEDFRIVADPLDVVHAGVSTESRGFL